MPDAVVFFVAGTPVTQGSMKKNAQGEIEHDSGDKLKGWRNAVMWRAKQSWREDPMDCPVRLELEFVLRRPKRPRWDLPATKPDLDKLIRAVKDSLEGVCYVNDSRVVDLGNTRKRYAQPGEETGVLISVGRAG